MKTKKLLSVTLAVLAILSFIAVPVVSGCPDARPEEDGIYRVYPDYNAIIFEAHWMTAYIYAENSQTGESYSSWPGEPMNYTLTNAFGEHQYFSYIPCEYNSVIIHNGEDQTAATDILGNCGLYLDQELSLGVYSVGFWEPNFVNTEPEYIFVGYCGDMDKSGIVNIKDATTIQKLLAGMSIPSYSRTLGDVDGNNVLNIRDATFIQKWLADVSVAFDIGTPIYTWQ